MNPVRSRQIEELFHAALGLAPDARADLLAQADPDLRREVESLLAHESGPGPLARPALEAAAQFLKEEAAAPPSQIGSYRILARLGAGGMGVVYQAEQEHPRRIVALKLMRPGWCEPELLRRFERESQALGRLQHPGIARIYEAGAADTGFGLQPYLVMEFIHGQSLEKYAESACLNTRQRLEMILKISDAVHHAHRRGIIHRDLKPANILVDENSQPKILDFGVARMTGSDTRASQQTDLGQLVGTLAYMSPEQVLADPLALDTRTDVYSLGVILYELLAGKPPYQVSRKLHEAVQTIRETDPMPLSSISRRYRGDIETIVDKALEKDKCRRYSTAAELAADIKRYLDDEPIAARPPSTAYQLGKFARRHRALVAGVAAVFVVLLAGIIASTWQAVRAERAGKAALAERDRANAAERAATNERNNALAAEARAVQERNRTLGEKRRADDESETAKAVSDFLQKDLLAQASANTQADPSTRPDPDLKVRTALDRAAARIAGKFAKQPLVEAAIRNTIGNAYKDLGLYPEAQAQLEAARALRAKTRGAEHPDTLSAMKDLAEVFWSQGKYAQAETLNYEVLEIQRRVLGEQHPDTLTSMNNLALVYMDEGKYPQAEKLHAKVLDVQRRVLGEQHLDTLTSMINLALAYYRQGKYPQAESLGIRELEIGRRVRGEEHPTTLSSMNNLALVYMDEGKYPQAEVLHAQTLEIRRRVLGEEHPDTLRSLNNLAITYSYQGKYPQSESLHVKGLEIRRRVLGEEHPNTFISMNNLGFVYVEEGKFEQAEALYTKVLELERRVLGEEHPITTSSMYSLGLLYRRQARYDRAEPLFLKVQGIRRRALGPQHPGTTDVMTSVGELWLRQERYTEAEPMLREALSTLERTSPDGWKRYYVQSLLGAVLAAQRRYADAEPLLLSGYAGMSWRKATMRVDARPHLTHAGEWIVQLYRDWGQPGKTTEWQAKLESEKTAAPASARK